MFVSTYVRRTKGRRRSVIEMLRTRKQNKKRNWYTRVKLTCVDRRVVGDRVQWRPCPSTLSASGARIRGHLLTIEEVQMYVQDNPKNRYFKVFDPRISIKWAETEAKWVIFRFNGNLRLFLFDTRIKRAVNQTPEKHGRTLFFIKKKTHMMNGFDFKTKEKRLNKSYSTLATVMPGIIY